MKAADINTKIIDSYISQLGKMDIQSKLEFISKLAQSEVSNTEQSLEDFYNAFGEWDEKDNAEELINMIRDSRTFYRTNEEF